MNTLIAIFLFLTAVAYFPGKGFNETQGLIFLCGVPILWVISLYFKPSRWVINKWLNLILGICLIETLLLKGAPQNNAILPLVNLFLGIAFFYIVANYITDLKPIINALCLVVVVNIVMVLLQATGNDPICLNGGGLKNTHLVGLFGFKFAFGSWMAVATPLLLFSRRAFFGVLSAILTICSLSWTAIAVMLLGCVGCSYFLNKRLFVIASILGVIIGAICFTKVLAVPTYYDTYDPPGRRFEHIMKLHPNSLAYKIKSRMDTQLKYLPIVATKPLQGFGLGSFKHIGPMIVNNFNSPYGVMVDAWCDYLEKAVEVGIVCVGAFLCMVYYNLLSFFKTRKYPALAFSLMTIPFLMLAQSMFNNYSFGVLSLTLFGLWEGA